MNEIAVPPNRSGDADGASDPDRSHGSQLQVAGESVTDESSAIEALGEQKPYLAATARTGLGTGGGGARPQTAPLGLEQQIAALEAKGEYLAAMPLKTQLLAERMFTNS